MDVVDLLEVVDVEHQEAEVAHVAPRAHELLVERLEQVALHVHLRETIDDGHPVNLFVVLRFHVLPGEELEDGRADLDAVAVAEVRFAHDLLVVDVRAVGRAVVDAPPGAAPLLEVRVPARDAVALEHDVVLGAAADADRARVEHEAPPEQGRLLRVDDHEAVVALGAAVAPARGFCTMAVTRVFSSDSLTRGASSSSLRIAAERPGRRHVRRRHRRTIAGTLQ